MVCVDVVASFLAFFLFLLFDSIEHEYKHDQVPIRFFFLLSSFYRAIHTSTSLLGHRGATCLVYGDLVMSFRTFHHEGV